MEWNKFMELVMDKGLLPLLLAIFAFWFNKALSSHKSDLDKKLSDHESGLDKMLSDHESALDHDVQTKIMIAKSRLPSYTSLWAITAPTTPTREEPIDDAQRKQLYTYLRNWYYESGNGLYLTNELRMLYNEARDSLRDCTEDKKSEEEITKIFSELRSELKKEIGIYGITNDA